MFVLGAEVARDEGRKHVNGIVVHTWTIDLNFVAVFAGAPKRHHPLQNPIEYVKNFPCLEQLHQVPPSNVLRYVQMYQHLNRLKNT